MVTVMESGNGTVTEVVTELLPSHVELPPTLKERLKEKLKEGVTSNMITSVRGDTPLTNTPTFREDNNIRLSVPSPSKK